jgi:hypothetical protein
MALCSNARRFSVDLARVRGVVEKQRVKEERVGWEGSLGGMAVGGSAALRSVGGEWQSNWELLEPFLEVTPLMVSRTFLWDAEQ